MSHFFHASYGFDLMLSIVVYGDQKGDRRPHTLHQASIVKVYIPPLLTPPPSSSSHFPIYTGSACRVTSLHLLRSLAVWGERLRLFKSSLTQSSHLFLGLPLRLCPGGLWVITFLVTCSSGRLWTWPYQRSRDSRTFSTMGATFKVPLTYSLRILSILVTPALHLNIRISATCTFLS